MRYPLENWPLLPRGFRFKDKTWYTAGHVGVDVIAPEGTEVYAPTNGQVMRQFVGHDGGNTIHFLDAFGALWRFLHLSSFQGPVGRVQEGDVIGLVGNTGALSRGAHLHTDISPNGMLDLVNLANFVDPETYIENHMHDLPVQNGHTIIVPEDHGRLYLIVNGSKCWAPDRLTMYSWGLLPQDATGVTRETADRYPDGPQLQYVAGKYHRLVDDMRHFYHF